MIDKIDIGLAVTEGKAQREILARQAQIALEEERIAKLEAKENEKRKIEQKVNDLVETLPALVKKAVIKGDGTFSLFEYLPNNNHYKNDREQQEEDNNIYQAKLLIDNLEKLDLKYTLEIRRQYNGYGNWNSYSNYQYISVQVPE